MAHANGAVPAGTGFALHSSVELVRRNGFVPRRLYLQFRTQTYLSDAAATWIMKPRR